MNVKKRKNDIKIKNRIIKKLEILYGKSQAVMIYNKLEKILLKYKKEIENKNLSRRQFSQKDAILITYGDFIQDKKKAPLQVLNNFAKENLKEAINIIHILPFYPYKSDRGFSVLDYKKVNPSLGAWKDIKEINKNFELMFDFVCNHISDQSEWFKEYSNGNKNYKDFFIEFGDNNRPSRQDIDKIFRPRTSDLLVKYNLSYGKKWLWKTFTHDQIDLNYKNYKVFLKMIDVFLFYVSKGTKIVRLDAIGYVWKKIGTNCFLIKESHTFVQLLRDILDFINPRISLTAEINTGVHYKKGLEYRGDSKNEAQVIYNFSFAPLILHTFYSENSTKLLHWINHTSKDCHDNTMLNILDCHDGIAILGVEEIIGNSGKEKLLEEVKLRKGKVSYRNTKAGKEPYEINITWWSALNNENSKEDAKLKVKKYLASRAIALSLSGIPGIYLLGLFGIENHFTTAKKTKYKRDINRRNLTKNQIEKFFVKKSKEYYVFNGFIKLLKIRRKEKSFHPKAKQKAFFISKSIFSIIRTSVGNKEKILVLINISDKNKRLRINYKDINTKKNSLLVDLISREKIEIQNNFLRISLNPYQTMWIKIKN